MGKVNRLRGFIDPVFIPIIVVLVCVIGVVVIKVKSGGHETPCEQAVEEVLEEVIKYEGHQLLADKTE